MHRSHFFILLFITFYSNCHTDASLIAAPAFAPSPAHPENVSQVAQLPSHQTEQLAGNPGFPGPCDGCCNDSCKPSSTCCLGWTCLTTVGPLYCAASLLCTTAGIACAPCFLVYDACCYDKQPGEPEPETFYAVDTTCLKPCTTLCGMPKPKKPHHAQFLRDVCHLPWCSPCAWYFRFYDNAQDR